MIKISFESSYRLDKCLDFVIKSAFRVLVLRKVVVRILADVGITDKRSLSCLQVLTLRKSLKSLHLRKTFMALD